MSILVTLLIIVILLLVVFPNSATYIHKLFRNLKTYKDRKVARKLSVILDSNNGVLGKLNQVAKLMEELRK